MARTPLHARPARRGATIDRTQGPPLVDPGQRSGALEHAIRLRLRPALSTGPRRLRDGHPTLPHRLPWASCRMSTLRRGSWDRMSLLELHDVRRAYSSGGNMFRQRPVQAVAGVSLAI